MLSFTSTHTKTGCRVHSKGGVPRDVIQTTKRSLEVDLNDVAFPCLSTCLSELFFIDLDQCFPGEDQMRQEIAGGNLNRICRTITYCYCFLLPIRQNNEWIEMY